MYDIASRIADWVAEDRAFALARVVSTWGSSPRARGAAMAVTPDLDVVGSVSGGCIEGEVIDAATDALAGGSPALLEFGISDETAWASGLSCGGRVSVLVELFPAFSPDADNRRLGARIIAALRAAEPLTWITSLDLKVSDHMLVDGTGQVLAATRTPDPELLKIAAERYRLRATGPVELSGARYFVHVIPPRSTLLVIGATDIATHLVRMASGLGFATIVIDPRTVFATEARFDVPPDRLLPDWPQDVLPEVVLDEETYAVLLTHDPKIDDPALRHLLTSNVAYIGALGSSRTHARRRDRLVEAGHTDQELDRIRGPVGLDIGASSPAEIALSILAEVVKRRNRV